MLLLWSGHAASSRWVTSEWLTACHMNRFIVPCVLDDTPLPRCLQNNVFLRVRRVTGPVVDRLVRAVREAPAGSNPLKHWDAIQAGRAPDDPLLAQAEQRFFEALAIDPTDPSALNFGGSSVTDHGGGGPLTAASPRRLRLGGLVATTGGAVPTRTTAGGHIEAS